MIPVLYDAQYYPGNVVALGKLPGWRELTVTEERNGEFVLEGELMVGSLNADKVGVDMVIRCAPAPPREDYSDTQPFRIRQCSKSSESDTIHIVANHISYQLRNYIMSPSFARSDNVIQDILDELNDPDFQFITPSQGLFGFHSPIELANAVQPEPDNPLSVRAWLGSDDPNSLASCINREFALHPLVTGQVLEVEFDWNNFDVLLKAPRGIGSNTEIVYGRNMRTVEFNTDTAELVTGYYGWYRGNNTFKHAVSYREDHGEFAHERIVTVDFSNEFESTPTDQQLQDAVDTYAEEQGKAVLPTSITVTAVPDSLQHLHLCDSVRVIHPGYGLSQLSKVVKVVYDPIRERYVSMTIGEMQTGITDTIARMLKAGRDSYVVI